MFFLIESKPFGTMVIRLPVLIVVGLSMGRPPFVDFLQEISFFHRRMPMKGGVQMLSESEIQEICRRKLVEINIIPACNDFVKKLENSDSRAASNKLQDIILFSISRCISEVLRENSRR